MIPTKGTRANRIKPVNRLNDLSAKEWIPETVSVWIQRGLGKGHEHAQIERQHPAPFSFQDIAKQKKVSLAWVMRDAAEQYIADQWPLFGKRQQV